MRLMQGHHPQLVAELPADVRLYEIAGPLFFGAAEKAAGQMAESSHGARAVIFYLVGVPMIDMTGLVALESSILKLHHAGVLVVLAAVNEEVARAIGRSHVATIPHAVSIHKTMASAEMYVRLVLPERQTVA